jgi:hypothetical protein
MAKEWVRKGADRLFVDNRGKQNFSGKKGGEHPGEEKKKHFEA